MVKKNTRGSQGISEYAKSPMAKKKFFTIEEVAEEIGISKQTILRYEKKGIFPEPSRNPINNWRRYTLKEVNKLKKICEGGL